MLRRDPANLVQAVRLYRIMAYVTGVVLIILVFVGIPLQVAAHNTVIVNYVGTLHGILYIIYLVAAFLMIMQVGMKLATPGTVIVLLAGILPVLTFVIERWVTRKYINPALAAAGKAPSAAGEAPSAAGRTPSTAPGTQAGTAPAAASPPSAQRPS
jgi:integral membrane protein